jgi:hypothetical protein
VHGERQGGNRAGEDIRLSEVGAGCRIDLCARMVDDTVALIDFKTQRFKNGKHTTYDDNLNQLAAEKLIIGEMIPIDSCINVYIARMRRTAGRSNSMSGQSTNSMSARCSSCIR